MKKTAAAALTPVDILARDLEAQLTREYGPILTGDPLRKSLGYASLEALRQAVSRRTVPVTVFALENRRGKYALAKDVARWLAEKRVAAGSEQPVQM